LKILFGTGREENLLANHKTGLSNMTCKIFRIS